MTTFHSLTVAKVESETRDAVTITFAVPQPLQEAYRFRPGQHLTLKASFDGEELRRCYSICRSYLPGEISVAVKAIEGGRFSRYAREHIRQGMTLEVMVPQGHFGYQPQAERQGRYLAIAAGSGITPMLAIIATTLQTEPESQFTLIYGNRTSQSMMFRQALADLKDKYPQRLQLLCIFSQETLDSDLLHGRIDGEKLQSLGASLINFRLYDEAFICGPAAMMDDAETALKALGMPDKTIHLERFNTPGTRVKRSVNVQSDGQKVTVRQDGRDREIVLNADDESILDAALRQGADLPYACKGGVCATCKCKVLRGKVAMETNYSLEPDELAAGYVLSCQALPLTSDVVVAGENARFGLPEITLGIMPGAGGTQRLIRSVGKSLASKMVLSGESITAQQAQQAGLVSDVFPSDLTLEYALQLASKMARHSPLALQAAKQALRQSQEVALQAGLAQERQLFTLLAATEDRHEGISAFLQKRTPDFKGR